MAIRIIARGLQFLRTNDDYFRCKIYFDNDWLKRLTHYSRGNRAVYTFSKVQPKLKVQGDKKEYHRFVLEEVSHLAL